MVQLPSLMGARNAGCIHFPMQVRNATTLNCCSIGMHFDPDHLPRALELLLYESGLVRVKGGCRSCRVESDVTDSGTIRYTEEWNSVAAFHRHVQSPEFWRILLALDLCSEEPEVMIGTVAAQYGMEVLRNLRSPSDGTDGRHAN
jgi:quinol monooxygenase YgiN